MLDTRRRFYILLITQLIGAFIILVVINILDSVDTIKIDFRGKIFVYIIACITFFVLIISSPLIKDYNVLKSGLKIKWSIWIIFILDLIGLSYLIYHTGGIPGSPFAPFLIYLPTNGIVLDQNLRTVVSYYLIIIIPTILLTLYAHNEPLVGEEFFYYKLAVLIIFIFTILTAIAGYIVRYSRRIKNL